MSPANHKTSLYLKDSKGNIRFWEISIGKASSDCVKIHHRYGVLGGKITEPIPREVCGENAEKKALTKMNAEIKKKRLLGFQEKIEKSVVRGSVFGPMGAHKLDDFAHKLRFPVMVQRKYDGYRCMARIGGGGKGANGGKVDLLSKSMKPFAHLQHIRDRLEEIAGKLNGEIYLDGELYSHGLKLNEIAKLIMKRRELTPDEVAASRAISFHVFDLVDPSSPDAPFSERHHRLKEILRGGGGKGPVMMVEGTMAKSLDEVHRLNDKYLMEGYEGVIVRNMDGLYQYKKKSYDVLRTKEFKHGLFEILGGKIGTGSYSSTVIWELRCSGSNSRKSFYAIQMGSAVERAKVCGEFKKSPGKFVGRRVRVKYLMIDDYGCVLRNPIVEGFADDT